MKKIFLTILSFLIAASAFGQASYFESADQASWMSSSGYKLSLGTIGADNLNLFTNNTRRWYIDGSTGALTSVSGVGLALGTSSVALGGTRQSDVTGTPLYIFADSATAPHLSLLQGTADTTGAAVRLYKSRQTNGTADTIVASGDVIGDVNFLAANGATFDVGARIRVTVDATPGASADMPAAIDFQVSPDGSATPASALKLTNDKVATFGSDVITAGNFKLTGTSKKIIGAVTSTLVRDNADANTNITIADGGTVTLRGLLVAPLGIQYAAGIMESVAAGTSVQGDGPLATGKYIHLVTGFDETKVATLPACAAGNVGEVHFILNSVTNKFAKIFPASGSQINSLGANAAYTQGVTGQGGKVLVCACQAATQWFCA